MFQNQLYHKLKRGSKPMNIKPLQDRVAIKRNPEETTSAGGIVIPDSATEKPSRGTVVAVGNGKVNGNGEVRPLDVKIGDQVLFGRYAGTELEIEGTTVIIMKEEDILGVVESS